MTTVRVAEVDLAELIIRMVECLRDDDRPPGLSNAQILERIDPLALEVLERQARAAADYVVECCHRAQLHRLQ